MTHTPLKGQVALVTGAGGDIGSAIARRLAAAGAQVVLTYRQSAAATQAVADSLAGSGHLVVQAPVDDSAAVQRLAALVTDHYGRLDILVNNAGTTRFVPHADLDALDDDLIDHIFRVNWRGAFAHVRAFRDLLTADDGGVVINISSIAGTNGLGSNIAYCASKAALDSLTRSLARALAPQIRVLSVAPGLVDGPYAASFDPAWKQEQVDRTPLGRIVSSTDVADTVYGAVVHMKMTTGSIVYVAGGRMLS
jgi:3-oxoacyl-[acyl-carrier protein] reductase